MRLFIFPFAPNVMRVQILLLEKRLAPEVVDVSADRDAYQAINPLGQVPALELDDGSILTESLTICQYLDAISGAPHLFGEEPEERLRIAMWERRAEMSLFIPGVEYGHHTYPMFAQWITQYPDWAATLVPKAKKAVELFADALDRTRYVGGERFSAADITALLGYFQLVAFGAIKSGEHASLDRWSAEMLARDSMAVLRQAAAQFGMAMPG